MTNIYDYFKATLGRYPADQSLRDLSVDSVCGQRCQQAIDHARTYLDAVEDDPNVVNPLLESIETAVSVFWVGEGVTLRPAAAGAGESLSAAQ